MYIKNLRIGNWVEVDGVPRKVTWLGNTYPRVDIDGVDVACKEDDMKAVPVTPYILKSNGWVKEKGSHMFSRWKKGAFVVQFQENGTFLEYSLVIVHLRIYSLHQLQNLIDDIELGHFDWAEFNFD